jgi:ribosomal protein S18 acetylase RimI-like enzyme
MEDAELKARAWAGVVDFTRLVGRHAPGASLYERDGVVACVVPGVPASILNAAIAVEPRAQPTPTDAIARVYADAKVLKWGVWIEGDDTAAADALHQAGLVLDSNPVLMGAELDDIAEAKDLPLTTEISLADVGHVNDLAYGFHQPRIGPILAGFPPGNAFHAYGAHSDGELACVAVVHDVEDDTFVTFVATLPHARGRGLATNLLRQALDDSKHRGIETTTLQASKAGQGIYAAIGYRPLGEQHLWERRP